MGVHPCCGNNDLMKTGVKVIAIYDMIVYGFTAGCLMVVFGLGVVGLFASVFANGEGHGWGSLFLYDLFLALAMFYLAFKSHISYQLWKGANEDNESKCRRWRIVHLIEFVVGLVFFIILCIGLIVIIQNIKEAEAEITEHASTNGVTFEDDKTGDKNTSGDISSKIYARSGIWFIASIVGCILRIYFIWLVSAFMTRIRGTRMPITDKGVVYNNFK